MLLTNRGVLGFVVEGTPYTAETLTQADFNILPYNIKVSPDIAMAAAKYAAGDFDQFQLIPGKRKQTIAFSLDLRPSCGASTGASLAVAPTWAKVLNSCSFSGTAFTSGYGWAFSKAKSRTPASLQFQIPDDAATAGSALAIGLSGGMGTVKFVVDEVGRAIRMDYEYTGAMVTYADDTMLTPASYDTAIAPGLLSSTVTAYTEALDFDKMEIDCGITVAPLVDPSQAGGIKGVNVTGWDPKMTIDPYAYLITTRGQFARWTAGTTGAFALTAGVWHMAAGAVQVEKAYDLGDRDGNATNNMVLALTRPADSSATFEIWQGAKA